MMIIIIISNCLYFYLFEGPHRMIYTWRYCVTSSWAAIWVCIKMVDTPIFRFQRWEIPFMGDNSNAALPKNKHVKTGCWQLRLSSTPNAASARKSKRFFSGQKGTHLQTMCDFGDWDSFGSKKSINHSIAVFPKRTILEVFWLVVDLPLWKIMEFINGKDDIPYMKWKIKAMFETTNQS